MLTWFRCSLKHSSTFASMFDLYRLHNFHGRSQDFSKGGGGGHTDSYRGYSSDCHLNIVSCLLTRRLTKGGSRAPQDPPPPGYAYASHPFTPNFLWKSNLWKILLAFSFFILPQGTQENFSILP